MLLSEAGCAVPLTSPILLNGLHVPSASFVGASLPAVFANGNGGEIVDFVRACARAGNGCVLPLPGCSIDYFHLAQHHDRWGQPGGIDHRRQSLSQGLDGGLQRLPVDADLHQ